jgi:lactoylglutathione lyase
MNRFNPLIPELAVADLTRSRHFYVEVLGFEVAYERPADQFVFLTYQGSQLMIQQDAGVWQTAPMTHPRGRGINLEIGTAEPARLLASLVTHNIPLFRPIMENWYRTDTTLTGNREFLVQDPDGYLLRFAEDMGHRPLALIYHVTTESDWQAQPDALTYAPASLTTEGFIHCSTAEQVSGVLERYYQNVPNLLLLHIDPALLTAKLRYDPATNGELFPHVYGPIDRGAVVTVSGLPPTP